jgi:Replication-relaxation
MNLAPAPKPLQLTRRDEEILASVYRYRFVTSTDIAHLLFRPSYLPYVRSRLTRLSGGNDLEENTYLCRFRLHATRGNPERIFTLGSKGRDFLQSQMGKQIDWFFRPGKFKFFSYSAILHHLLLTRFLVACSWWCRDREDTSLVEERISYDLSRDPPQVKITKKEKPITMSVIPDAWLLFAQSGRKYALIFELDRGMEYQEKFKQHVRSRIELIRTGRYQEVFGVPGVIIAYLTTGQTPEYRTSRMKTMNGWTREVLAELNLKNWGGIFRFASVEFDSLYDQTPALFEEPVWLRPDMKETVGLFS